MRRKFNCLFFYSVKSFALVKRYVIASVDLYTARRMIQNNNTNYYNATVVPEIK